jgi:hypothetical protein
VRLKIVASFSMVRVPNAEKEFWRAQTKRLVVVVERPHRKEDKLLAWGIDQDVELDWAIVFKASFPVARLPDVVAGVFGDIDAIRRDRKHVGPAVAARDPAVRPSGGIVVETYGDVSNPGGGNDGPRVVRRSSLPGRRKPARVASPRKLASLVALARRLVADNIAAGGFQADIGSDRASKAPAGGDTETPTVKRLVMESGSTITHYKRLRRSRR